MTLKKKIYIALAAVAVVAAVACAVVSYQAGRYLRVLKESAPYESGSFREGEPFTYASAGDSCMMAVRQFFNLDSIAGRADEVSQMISIMTWLHDNIRHDGWGGFPKGVNRNSIDLYKACREQQRGLNCRGLAIVLSEMYMAMGWPARFVTCQSHAYDTDNDCHVICMVWSRTLGQWLWMDPTFAAYVMDERGNLLGIREVRQRLIDGLPLQINDDANWNHEDRETKEQYLDIYMAKNLYYISTHLHNGFGVEPAGIDDTYTLTPVGITIDYGTCVHDDDWFWQAPE